MNDEKQTEILKEQINKFIIDIACVKNINDESDIFLDLGINGDDFHELIEKFSLKFKVDMKSYLWYFHTNEEGQNLGGSLFKAPNERVERIPVTPKMLYEFAKSSKWDINYPEHTLPKRRYDLYFNTTIGVILIIILIWKYFFK